MIIRVARIEDVSRLCYLIRNNTSRVKENRYTPAQQAAWRAENTNKALKEKLLKRTTFCAFEHNRLVGTIAIEENLLCGMYVSYSKRGQGIGQELMHHLEEHARKIGIIELILTATANGYGFYVKNGYKAYGEMVHVFSGIEFPEIKMRKKIL